jgi:uncharacterized integral membrane protein
LIVVFVIAIIMVALVVANRQFTRLDLIVTQIDVPEFVVVLIAWGFGMISYAIFALIGEIRLRTRLARQKRETDLLMRELNDLRNLPLAGEESGSPAEETLKEPS